MKKHNLKIALVFSLVIAMGGCSPKVYTPALWQSGTCTIDGKSNEWPEILQYYDTDSKLMYEVRNDDDLLYISVKSNDENTARRMAMTGIEFTLQPNIEEKREMKIVYPFREGLPPIPQQLDKGKLPVSSQFKISGFSPAIADGVYEQANSNQIKAAFSEITTGSAFLEISIPLESVLGKEYSIADSARVLKLELTLPLVEMPSSSDFPMPPGGASEGGGMPQGPPPGAGGPGGPDGGGPPSMNFNQLDMGKKSCELKFKLAQIK
jgi:hypothetical protein